MKKYLTPFLIVGLVLLTSFYVYPKGVSAACGNGYSFCQTFTVNHLKVANTDQTGFTVMATTTQATLKTTGSGGSIQHTVSFNGQTVPADLVFTSDSACTTLLSWDFASYTTTTGQIEVYILFSTLHTASDDVIYMCYGKSSVSTYQGGSVGAAYDANTVAIYHTADGTTLNLKDSSANGYNMTNNGLIAATGQIDGGTNNNSSASNNATSPTITSVTAKTISVWVNISSNGNYQMPIAGNGGIEIWAAEGGTNHVRYIDGTNLDSTVTVTDGTWHLITGVSSAGTQYVYIDGVQKATSGATAQGLTSFTFTNRAGSTSYPLNGSMDEVEISNTNRTADWIATTFNNQVSVGTFITFGTEQSSGGGATPITPQHKFIFAANHKFIFAPNHKFIFQ